MNKLKATLQKHPALAIVFGFQLFRLLLLPFMGLMPQDAYYSFLRRKFITFLFRSSRNDWLYLTWFTEVFGKTVFVIKLADFLVTSFTLLSFYKLATYFLSKQEH